MNVFAVLFLLVVLVGCTQGEVAFQNISNSSDTHLNISENLSSAFSPPLPSMEISQSERERRLRAKGFGILDLNRLTRENCPGFLDVYEHRLITEKDALTVVIERFDSRQQSMQQAQSAYDQSLTTQDEHIIERAKEELDAAQDLFDDADTELKDQQELVRKLDLLLKEMKQECTLLEAA